jgi:uncharacterized protein YegP (UPF0339 family)
MAIYSITRPFYNDDIGRTLAGARLNFYDTGTFDRKDTYFDSALTSVQPNPVIADGAGRFDTIYLATDSAYRVVLEDENGNTIWTQDDVESTPGAQDVINSILQGDYYTATGTNAHTITAVIGNPSTLEVGMTAHYDAPANSTGAVTVIWAGETLSMVLPDTTAVGSGYIASGDHLEIRYDGTNAVLYPKFGTSTGQIPLAEDVTIRSTGSEFATYGGAADAITLTTSRTLSALTAGQGFWFIPTATNTTAFTVDVDGIGPVNAKTITGVNPPAGYLIANEPTFLFYDGTNVKVDRQIERGSDSNGDYTRYADGSQVCTNNGIPGAETQTVFGVAFSEAANTTWTYPKPFIKSPVVTGDVKLTSKWLSIEAPGTTNCIYRQLALASNAASHDAVIEAEGYWY